MKKTFTTFNKFAEKVIDVHLNVNHLMSVASNDVKEGDAQPDVQDFVDVLLHMAKTDTNITRETIKSLVLVCDRQALWHSILFITLFYMSIITLHELIGFVYVQDMFAAGLETISTELEWVMSELFRHPPAIKRLQEEIESVVGQHRKVKESDLVTMKYLHCVVKESLRL